MFSGAEPFVQLFRGHLEEQCCEFISKLGQWFRWHLKDFLSGACRPSCSVERNHLCNLKESIMGNIHVKLF